MAFFTKEVREQIQKAKPNIFFVSGKVTKWFNERRVDPNTELALLGGWYWARDDDENGPFRTPSAAQRDFFYRLILGSDPPSPSMREVRAVERTLESERERAAALVPA
jgi:hypothetical protein